MEYKVRHRIFSFGAAYAITDENGEPAYRVQTSLATFGNSLEMFDAANNVVATIQEQSLAMRPAFRILRDGLPVADVHKDLFTVFHAHYTVRGPIGDFDMDGDWSEWRFSITSGGTKVAHVQREQTLISDLYSVRILADVDVPTILCLAIVVDEVAHPPDS